MQVVIIYVRAGSSCALPVIVWCPERAGIGHACGPRCGRVLLGVRVHWRFAYAEGE